MMTFTGVLCKDSVFYKALAESCGLNSDLSLEQCTIPTKMPVRVLSLVVNPAFGGTELSLHTASAAQN